MANPQAENKRNADIRVRLHPDMMDRLGVLATAHGMPPSTMAAFAIADWVLRQENNAKVTRMAVLDATRNSVSPQNIERAIEAMMPTLVKALGQENLPLDGEASKEDA